MTILEMFLAAVATIGILIGLYTYVVMTIIEGFEQ